MEPNGRAGRLAAAVPLVLGCALAGALAYLEPPRRPANRQVYRIPVGTAQRVAAGLPIEEVLPQHLVTTVGATLVVQNEDTTNHQFGPFVLEPGQSWSRRFAMDGEYALTCSLYPAVEFVIDVAPVSGGPRLAATAHRAWAAAWSLLAGALAAALAFVTARSGRHLPRPVHLAALALPGGAAVLAALHALALSRVTPWDVVLTSRASPFWLASVAVALAAALGAALAAAAPAAAAEPPLPDGRTPLATRAIVSASGLAVLGLILGLWPSLGQAAGRWALTVTGAALLVHALVAYLRAGSDADGAPGSIGAAHRRLALAGLALFLAGLPWPAITPPVEAARGATFLALAAAVVWIARRPLPVEHAGLGRVVGGAGGLVAVMGALLLWDAMIGHVDAVTIPLAGNPVVADTDSVARGRSLWDAHCAACHEDRPDVSALPDREALELITRGRGDKPGFAYRLELSQRGDVLNYLRASDAGDGRPGS